jgi:DNA-binding response OmpR family regulator
MNARILIVDDEPSVRALVRDILELDDYNVTEAVDGEQAMARFQGESFHLVILDIMMPGISGLDVLRRIRATAEAIATYEGSDPETPVILLTAASDDDTTWAGWTSGASVFLAKPFDPNNLLEWVERTLAGETAVGPGSTASSTKSKPAHQVDADIQAEFRGLNG